MRVVHSLAFNAAVFTVMGILYAIPFVSGSDSDLDVEFSGGLVTTTTTIISDVTTIVTVLLGPSTSIDFTSVSIEIVDSSSQPLFTSSSSHTESGNSISSSLSVTLQTGLPSQTTSPTSVTVEGAETYLSTSSADTTNVAHLSAGAVAGVATLTAILIAVVFFILGRSRFARRRSRQSGVLGELKLDNVRRLIPYQHSDQLERAVPDEESNPGTEHKHIREAVSRDVTLAPSSVSMGEHKLLIYSLIMHATQNAPVTKSVEVESRNKVLQTVAEHELPKALRDNQTRETPPSDSGLQEHITGAQLAGDQIEVAGDGGEDSRSSQSFSIAPPPYEY